MQAGTAADQDPDRAELVCRPPAADAGCKRWVAGVLGGHAHKGCATTYHPLIAFAGARAAPMHTGIAADPDQAEGACRVPAADAGGGDWVAGVLGGPVPARPVLSFLAYGGAKAALTQTETAADQQLKP